MPPWWALFDTKKEDMDAVCKMVTALYSHTAAAYTDLSGLPPPKAGAPAAAAPAAAAPASAPS